MAGFRPGPYSALLSRNGHDQEQDQQVHVNTEAGREAQRNQNLSGHKQQPTDDDDEHPMHRAAFSDEEEQENSSDYAGVPPFDRQEARNGHAENARWVAESRRRRETEAELGEGGEGGDGGDGGDDYGSIGGGPAEPTFDDFDEANFRCPGAAQPLLEPSDEPWKLIRALGRNDCRPKRAMCINIMSDFWRRDAEFFKSWAMPKGNESRCKATAALVSLLFAGTAMGIPSGKHEEKMRDHANAQADEGGDNGAKKDPPPLRKVSRYTYAPHLDESDSYQMWEMGLGGMLNFGQTEASALRIWLFIYDETHSTSALVRKVIDEVRNLHDSQRAGAQAPTARSKPHAAETSRRDKANMGFDTVGQDLEATAGMQYTRISSTHQLQKMYELHAGRTSSSEGRPRYTDLATLLHCPAGRRKIDGDFKTGCGGKHPLGPENMFNAKVREGLEFGLADMDGGLPDECIEQTDPRNYFTDEGYFQVPDMQRSCFWMCTCPDILTPFDMPLARPLQGTVIPGDNLLRCFAEKELRDRNAKAGRPTTRVDWSTLTIDQGMTSRLRSLATRRDEHQRKQNMMLANNLRSYDLMSAASALSTMSNSDVDFNPDATGDEANYTIKTLSMTTRVSREADRIYEHVVAPWKAQREKELDTLHAKLIEDDLDPKATPTNPRCQAYFRQRTAFDRLHYAIKKDLVQYLLRLLKTCFLSAKDAATVPAGYKAMFKALEEGLDNNGGSASIAFNGGGMRDGIRDGRQITSSDRMPWGELQEFLRYIFADCAKIDGRDRRIMDEMYLHSFEMYSDQTFILIIASDKGKGKSIRADRFAALMPEGWTSENGANSARAGMNGNNSPSNGTQIHSDEMFSDLVPAQCTERMEFYKTIVGKREYGIERTRNIKNQDGTDSMLTFKIVTDHKECILINCNMGQCFTAVGEEPSSGKEALIQRTVFLTARKETNSASPDAQFKETLKRPQVMAAVRDFRLFTALVGYVRMTMMGLDWLQPDFAFANVVFREADAMIEKEHGLPKPEPRRLQKRSENLKTMCVMDAVARVFFFKQTAVRYEAGKPDRAGRGKEFEIGDLWDVIRTMHPTREMIIAAWSHSLEYSIGTSAHGTNMMTAVCEKVGMHIDHLFMEIPTETPQQLVHNNGAGLQHVHGWRMLMNEVEVANPPGSVNIHAVGARTATLDAHREFMRESRIARNEFRAMAANAPQSTAPLEAIRAVVGPDPERKYTNALFPLATYATMYYKPKALLVWATNGSVPVEESGFREGGLAGVRVLPFKERKSEGGSKHFDFGWFKLHDGAQANWSSVAREMKNMNTCTLFDMHVAGIADALFMMASSENNRLCAEMPILPYAMRPSAATVAPDGSPLKDDTPIVKISSHAFNGTTYDAVDDSDGTIEPRPVGHMWHKNRVRMHRQLDCLHQRGKLPMLQPFSSTNLARMPPVRRVDETAFEVNSMACLEHLLSLMEAILSCSTRPGLRGLQEKFASGGSAPKTLHANQWEEALPASVDKSTLSRMLPYAIDIMQMHWTLDLADRFYSPSRKELLEGLNQDFAVNDLGSPIDTKDDVPHLTLRYPGFPSKETRALRLLSVRPPDAKPAGQAEVDIASSEVCLLNNDVLRYETEIAIGRDAEEADIEAHRRMLIGDLYTYGISGDVYNYDTWIDHLEASMIGRGNTDGVIDPQTDAYRDEGFRIMSDAELMSETRMLERECAKDGSPYKHYRVNLPKMRTHANIEKYGTPADDTGAEGVGGARKRKEAPLTSMSGAARQLATLHKRLATAGVREPLRRGVDGDSRSDDDE